MTGDSRCFIPHGPARAERLLAAIHPVCSHDLPNVVVALQGLLQLFEWDEASQLSGQGREHLTRLQSLAAKTTAMCHHLKELVRLQRREVVPTSVRFADLLDEVRAELRRAMPDLSLAWNCRWDVGEIVGDRQLLQAGVVGIVRSVLTPVQAAAAVVDMETHPAQDRVEWTVRIRPDTAAPALPVDDSSLLEGQLALDFARICLAVSGVTCVDTDAALSRGVFTLSYTL
ncbi:MAG: hypothetical protein NZO58_03975 [Gemmataceae bacterium]|nr:hypothetical protein [Gemmataceae bacterium]